MQFANQNRYKPGSKVQDKKGYIRIKRYDGSWVTEHRFVASEWGDVTGKSGELKEGEKVYHINGVLKNDPKNIIRIQFNTTKFRLAHSRVLWIPPDTKHLTETEYAKKIMLDAVRQYGERRKQQISWAKAKERRGVPVENVA